MSKYGFVYIWRDRKRNMYYVGSHWGTEKDSYICSSNRMRDAYRRRPNDFKRRILKTNIPNKSLLLDEEYRWLQMITLSELGSKYYNLKNYRFNHWNTDKAITISKKISIALTGRKLSREHCRKIGLSKIGNTNLLGFSFPQESKLKMRNAKLGTKRSDISRKKQSETITGIKRSDEIKAKLRKPKTVQHAMNISKGKKGKPNGLLGKKRGPYKKKMETL